MPFNLEGTILILMQVPMKLVPNLTVTKSGGGLLYIFARTLVRGIDLTCIFISFTDNLVLNPQPSSHYEAEIPINVPLQSIEYYFHKCFALEYFLQNSVKMEIM